jgi:glucose/arabinose dehydrogenase
MRAGAVLAVVATLLGACAVPTASGTAVPTNAGGTLAPLPTATAAAAGTPPASDTPFVAANVQVGLAAYAQVDGGALAIAAPDDGSGRLFVATQQGQVWSISGGASQDLTAMLDISDRITSGGERGLLGLALHPGFPTDPRAFVDYTDLNGDTVVSSFTLTSSNPNRFDPASEQVILQVDQPFSNHNGGGVVFGPDGFLYVALGDGGGGGDPNGNGQNLGTLLAKMLRIDVDHPAAERAYGIPADNPFVGRDGARPEIWLYGLRNPFRMSFDRDLGDLWIGDVGQGRWEEVDVVRAGDGGGQDFGWNITEGNHCYKPAENCDTEGLTRPVSEYAHDQGCAIIGGYVYRGSEFPELRGGYLFSDSCSGTIWAIPATTERLVQPVPVGETGGSPAGFGEDPDGELYLANLDGGILRITASSR